VTAHGDGAVGTKRRQLEVEEKEKMGRAGPHSRVGRALENQSRQKK
jgi:hypothetical protein